MNRAIINFDRATLDKIHQYSLDLLADIGIQFPNQDALDLFSRSGFRINGNTVYFSHDNIQKALDTVPETFTIQARDAKKQITIGNEKYHVAPGYGPPFIIEPSGEKRHALLADALRFYKLVQDSEYLDFCSSLVVQPHDVPVECAHRELLLASLTLTDKPIMGSSVSRQAALDSIQMAQIVWGCLDRPVMISLINSLAPLQFASEMIEALMVFASHGQPLIVHSACTLGTSGPITIPGSLVISNATTLSGICLAQLVKPGTPIVYGLGGSPTDMRTGGYVNGSPEDVKHTAISPVMGRYYGIPSRSQGALTESFSLDYQAGMESAMMLTAAALSGAHVGLHACGTYGSMLSMSFEKFIADEELCGAVKRVAQPLSFSADNFAMDLIRSISTSGSYLVQEHTLKRCRSEFFLPKLNIRTTYEDWKQQECGDMTTRASRCVEDRMAAYQKPPMESSIASKLLSYVESRR